MLLNNVDKLTILPQQCDGFLGACKNLSIKIKQYVEENIEEKNSQKIIWLEDDWELIEIINLNDLIKFSGKHTHINLTGLKLNYFHALAPSILPYKLWEHLFYDGWINQKINICPEKCVANTFHNKYTNTSQKFMKNITIDIFGTGNAKVYNRREQVVKINESYKVDTTINSDNPVFIRTNPPLAKDRGIEYAKTMGYLKTYQKDVKYTPYVMYKKI